MDAAIGAYGDRIARSTVVSYTINGDSDPASGGRLDNVLVNSLATYSVGRGCPHLCVHVIGVAKAQVRRDNPGDEHTFAGTDLTLIHGNGGKKIDNTRDSLRRDGIGGSPGIEIHARRPNIIDGVGISKVF